MNIQQLGSFSRGLFWVLLTLGVAMNLSDMGTLPLLLIFALVAGPLLFPNLRRRIRLRRVFLFSFGGMLVFLGMFSWFFWFNEPDYSDMFSDEWAIWPFGDYLPDGSLPHIYWPPLWIFKGLLSGFMVEFLVVLGQYAWANLTIKTLPQDEPPETNQPPLGVAGGVCLACMAVVYLVSMPLLIFYPSSISGWLLAALYIIVPLSGVFLVLYFSGCYRQRTTAARLFSVIWRACAVFGIASLFVVFVILMLVFLQCRFFDSSRGQYGA